MQQKETKKNLSALWDMGFATIKELETDQGILASSREEIYGCIFGRDSLITALRLLRAYKLCGNRYFLELVKKILLNLATLQGKKENPESGEQLGKIIHEYRPTGHEHLTQRHETPWYVYEDNVMRNFDSVDSTPLYLICTLRYYQACGDKDFLAGAMPHIHMALIWLSTYSDLDGDGFVDFEFPKNRKSGGLKTQNWMDSEESIFHEDGTEVAYPIAPVEVQGYTYLALRLWSKQLSHEDPGFAEQLKKRADELKVRFNQRYVVRHDDKIFIASAIDGYGKPLESVRSSMGHCLWASLNQEQDGTQDSILEDQYIPLVAHRLLEPDLFEPEAGIRTLSTRSCKYDPYSYHNGSIWPHDCSMVIEGLLNFGFTDEASRVHQALLKAYEHFQTPLELFVYDKGYKQYQGPHGSIACQKQAWSAASLLVESAKLKI